MDNKFGYIFPLLFFWSVMICTNALGQDDSLRLKIDSITISAPRMALNVNRIPMSYNSIDFTSDELRRLALNQGLQTGLQNFPGLQTSNSHNKAQDLRISIRGFGARSAFGIRGIKLIVDGIPETTPDGQGQVDNIDVNLIKHIRVLRGPSSALFGNASGGVIFINTIPLTTDPFMDFSLHTGAYGRQNFHTRMGLGNEKSRFVLSISHNRSDGYRQHSAFRESIFSGFFQHRFSELSKFNWHVNYTTGPLSQDPGSLTLSDVDKNRLAAREQNIEFDAGESIVHFKTGLHYEQAIKRWNLRFRTFAFYAHRNYDGKLPFLNEGIIELFRNFGGQGSSLEGVFKVSSENVHRIQLGYEIILQKDHRKRFNNVDGENGNLEFDQEEMFSNLGVYLLDQWTYQNFVARIESRYDRNEITARDRFLFDGNDSDYIFYNSISYGASLGYGISTDVLTYLRYSTSFETPALSELSAIPDGSQGLNGALLPQSSQNIELGLKKSSPDEVSYDITVFHILTKDEILPYEIAEFPGRNFYRNAGKTLRTGLETSVQCTFHDRLSMSGGYTFSYFRFNEYVLNDINLQGLKLPGLPIHSAYHYVEYNLKDRLYFSLSTRFSGSVYLNDKNTVEEAGFIECNLSVHGMVTYKKWKFYPFFRIHNLTDSDYYDNLRINAFGGRYYEVAPPRNYSLGIRMEMR